MTQSMTGFASRTGTTAGWSWTWEIRSVNARGLDIRLRLPEGLDGVEAPARAAVAGVVRRGSVTLSLRLGQDGGGTVGRLDEAALDAVLSLVGDIEARSRAAGVALAPVRATDLMALRGVYNTGTGAVPDEVRDTLLTDLPHLTGALAAARAAEGASLAAILSEQVDRIEALTAQAASEAEACGSHTGDVLRRNVDRLLETTEAIGADRLAQELALIATRSDVTEEIDRLRAHVAAARSRLAENGPVGRPLDFLVQEFNREANTLCAKSQSTPLTAVGLDLKQAIDQMREQIQNVE